MCVVFMKEKKEDIPGRLIMIYDLMKDGSRSKFQSIKEPSS